MTRAELIAAVEAATGPSRELDGEIAATMALHPPSWRRGAPAFNSYIWLDDDMGELWVAPRFTASIDAALTLVPADTWWGVNWIPAYSQPPPYASASVTSGTGHYFVKALTLTLALCIAALRARGDA